MSNTPIYFQEYTWQGVTFYEAIIGEHQFGFYLHSLDGWTDDNGNDVNADLCLIFPESCVSVAESREAWQAEAERRLRGCFGPATLLPTKTGCYIKVGDGVHSDELEALIKNVCLQSLWKGDSRMYFVCKKCEKYFHYLFSEQKTASVI